MQTTKTSSETPFALNIVFSIIFFYILLSKRKSGRVGLVKKMILITLDSW
jgi:hypothetical protein